ncbi:MAG: hypothetical protein ACREOW_13245 [Thermodesulfobacteriota bacterium]
MRVKRQEAIDIRVKDLNYLIQLLNPQFVYKDGCFFLEAHFDEENYKKHWKRKVLEDRQKVEATINHVHLGDLVEDTEEQEKLGKKLKEIWQEKLSELFPPRRFELILSQVLFDSDYEWVLDLWMKRD